MRAVRVIKRIITFQSSIVINARSLIVLNKTKLYIGLFDAICKSLGNLRALITFNCQNDVFIIFDMFCSRSYLLLLRKLIMQYQVLQCYAEIYLYVMRKVEQIL